MFEALVGFVVNIVVSVLAVKMYFGSQISDMQSREKKLTWKESNEAISQLENRLAQLQVRDTAAQETIWNLEDQNRVLKLHIMELKREIAAKTPPEQPFILGDD